MTYSRRTGFPLYIYCSLMGASLLCASAIGQTNSVPAPPGHLPRFLWECELGAGANTAACSVWTWEGSFYSATWSIGAIGHLTVTSSDHGEIKVQRQDTAGNLAGLNATYTAKWDGTRLSDGKMAFTFKGTSNTGIWSGAPLVTPVVHTASGMVRTITQDEIYGVGRGPVPYYNWYSADLTAFAIHSERFEGSANSTVVDDFRVRGEQPMKPGDRRELSLKSKLLQPNYEGGATYRFGMAIAAIYADGTTFGDPKVLAEMIGYRRSMLSALTDISATLCQLGGQQASIADVAGALAKQQAAADSRSASDKSARAAAYTYIDKSLSGRGHFTPAQSIKRTWDALDKLRSGLADPVKNGSSEPAISPVKPLTCHLPS
jgi:hypothetical protein